MQQVFDAAANIMGAAIVGDHRPAWQPVVQGYAYRAIEDTVGIAQLVERDYQVSSKVGRLYQAYTARPWDRSVRKASTNEAPGSAKAQALRSVAEEL